MAIPEAPAAHQRLIGISIEVPPPFAQELTDSRASFGDSLAHSIPPHITLLGPTIVDNDNMDLIREHLLGVCAQAVPFRIHLRGSATFRPVSPVVFIQVVQGISECESLERAVRSGPLEVPIRFNYHPHVTIAHEVDEAALDRAFAEMNSYEAVFQVNKIHLFEQGRDGVWRPVSSFVLGS